MAGIRKKKYNTETFKSAVSNIVGEEYTVLGEYTKSSNKILMRHNICGHEWEVNANSFLNVGNRCPVCGKPRIKEDEFKKRVQEQTGDEYSVIGQYDGYDKKVMIRHNACGHEWLVTPRFFVGEKRNRCPNCNRGPVSEEMAAKRVKDRYGDSIVLTEYQNASSPVSYVYNECGHTGGAQTLGELLRKNNCTCPVCQKEKKTSDKINKLAAKKQAIEKNIGHLANIEWLSDSGAVLTCKKCGAKQIKKTLSIQSVFKCDCSLPKKPKSRKILAKMSPQEIAENINSESNGDFTVLDSYSLNEKQDICKIKCNRCGLDFSHKLDGAAYSIHDGRDICPYCGGWKNKRKTNEQVQKELDLRYGKNEYVLLSDYVNCETKIKVRHSCGREYEITPGTLFNSDGKRTNMCNGCYSQQKSSHGEKIIKTWLDGKQVKYISQFPIVDPVRGKYNLFYDFMVLNDKGTPIAAIEYDGVQHSKPVKLFGGVEGYKRRKRNDEIKNQYCYDNRIEILRVKYDNSDTDAIRKVEAFLMAVFFVETELRAAM